MTLNSLDVQNKTFNQRWRGFDKREVDEFLDIIIRDYDDFAQTHKDQDRELKTLRERVKYFDDMKDSLNKSIVVAQDAADNLRAQAQSEANNIITDAGQKSQLIIEAAKKEAGSILAAASDDARQLLRDTDDMKRKMRLYHQRMTSMIESQLETVQSEEWVEILKPTSSDYLINPEAKLQEILEKTLKTADRKTASLEISDQSASAIYSESQASLGLTENSESSVAESSASVSEVSESESSSESIGSESSAEATSLTDVQEVTEVSTEKMPSDEENFDAEATIDLGDQLSQFNQQKQSES